MFAVSEACVAFALGLSRGIWCGGGADVGVWLCWHRRAPESGMAKEKGAGE